MSIKLLVGMLTAGVIILIFIGQANAANCDVVYRDCSAECPAGTYDCLASCNQANAALYDQARECAKQESEQGQQEQEQEPEEGEQIGDPLNVIPSYSIPKKGRQASENVSPTPQATVRRLDAGIDIKPGETITAKQGEILLIDFRGGNFVEVNSGASFTYEEKKNETAFEILKGSLRFIFEAASGTGRKVYMSSAVAAVRGTDFVVNEKDGKSEVLVFDGKLAVSDVNGENTVEVPGGYKTEAVAGGKPSKPEPLDWTNVDRWFDAITPENSQKPLTPEKWAVIAAILIGGPIIIFFSIKKTIKNLRKKKKR